MTKGTTTLAESSMYIFPSILDVYITCFDLATDGKKEGRTDGRKEGRRQPLKDPIRNEPGVPAPPAGGGWAKAFKKRPPCAGAIILAPPLRSLCVIFFGLTIGHRN